MLRKGIYGKDLGKRGTATEDTEIPEALGIAPGAVFLVCLIICLVGFATSHPTKVQRLFHTASLVSISTIISHFLFCNCSFWI
jgi:hypothetical protein